MSPDHAELRLCLTNGYLFWRCRRSAKVRNGDDYESYDVPVARTCRAKLRDYLRLSSVVFHLTHVRVSPLAVA